MGFNLKNNYKKQFEEIRTLLNKLEEDLICHIEDLEFRVEELEQEVRDLEYHIDELESD